MRPFTWGAALHDADVLHLGDAIAALQEAGCAELHLDVAEPPFAEGFGLGYDAIKAVCEARALLVHVHLQTEAPDRWIGPLAKMGCARITVHAEAAGHLHRTLRQIRDTGASPGIALNPATPLTALQYVFDEVDGILLLMTEPGGSQEANIPPASFERIKILRENLGYLGRKIELVVEGPLDVQAAGQALALGADALVLGAANIFAPDYAEPGVEGFLQELDVARRTA